MSKSHIRKGDIVYVLAGEDRGKEGRVLKVLKEKHKAVVEGVNIVTKATKPSAQHPQGGLIKMEAPIQISNIALIDPKTGKPTRVSCRRDEKGNIIRISKKSGEVIK
ncbi:MAG: 50S ribosomal protein L24 [Duncaniella sp.]|nr:50S ribosomal protein L24 [Bacteroides sp.]MDE5826732.1 50S ribosomal protein L24 [Duncaniella sp.]MBD5299949.1 50S ribosomal protein L24 [Bacteroides sp.]MBD5319148.1 50S ribosomal protein L24 [Bacteroides sp.]MBD5353959.1 50S ribosomal protein L24 [Bacteroides sp.]